MKKRMKTLKRFLAFMLALALVAGSVKWELLTVKAETDTEQDADGEKGHEPSEHAEDEEEEESSKKPEGEETSEPSAQAEGGETNHEPLPQTVDEGDDKLPAPIDGGTQQGDGSAGVPLTQVENEKTDEPAKLLSPSKIAAPDVAAPQQSVKTAADEDGEPSPQADPVAPVILISAEPVVYGEDVVIKGTVDADGTLEISDENISESVIANAEFSISIGVKDAGENQELSYTFTPKDQASYETAADTLKYTVKEADAGLAVTFQDDITYGDVNKVATFTTKQAGTLSTAGNTYSLTESGTQTVELDTSRAGENILTYSFTPNSTNYETITDREESYTVSKKTITVTSVTFGESKVYDGSEKITDVTPLITLSGILSDDEEEVSVEKALSFSTDDKKAESDKPVTIQVTGDLEGNKAGNYVIDANTLPTNTVITVVKRDTVLTVEVSGSKVYDGTKDVKSDDIEITIDDAVSGENAEVNRGSFAVKANTSDVTTTDLTWSDLTMSGEDTLSLENYNITSVVLDSSSTYGITKRPVSIAVKDGVVFEKYSDGTDQVTMAVTADQFVFEEEKENERRGVLAADVSSLALNSVDANGWTYSKDENSCVLPGTGLSITGLSENNFTLSGTSADNYEIDSIAGDTFKGTIKANETNEKELDLTSSSDGVFTLSSSTAPSASQSITVEFAPGAKSEDGINWYNEVNVPALAGGTVSLLDVNNTAYSLDVTQETDGTDKTFTDVYIKDASNVVYGPVMVKYNLDKTAPEADITFVKVEGSTQNGEIDFSNDKLIYTIQVSDNLSGIRSSSIQYYAADKENDFSTPVEWKTPNSVAKSDEGYSFQVTVPAAGYLYVKVSDNAGNEKTSSSLRALVLERTIPEITVTVDGEVSGNKKGDSYEKFHTISISAEDPNSDDLSGEYKYSGIRKITYTLTKDGEQDAVLRGEYEQAKGPASLEELSNFQSYKPSELQNKEWGKGEYDGTYTLTVEAMDYCGNSTTQNVTLNFDNTAPVVTVQVSGTGNEETENKFGSEYWYKNIQNIQVIMSDEHLGATSDKATYEVLVSDSDDTTEDLKQTYTPVSDATKDRAFTFDSSKLKDGTDNECVIQITAVDAAGNKTTEITTVGTSGVEIDAENKMKAVFYLDTVAPVLSSVALTKNDDSDIPYYEDTKYAYINSAFTVTYKVDERNYSGELVNAGAVAEEGVQGKTPIAAQTSIEQAPDQATEDPKTITVSVDPNGETIAGDVYKPFIQVKDKAGNVMVLSDEWNNDKEYNEVKVDSSTGKATIEETAFSGIMLDTKSPTASVTFTENTKHVYDLTTYYNKEFEVNIKFKDEINLLDGKKLFYQKSGAVTDPVEDDNSKLKAVYDVGDATLEGKDDQITMESGIVKFSEEGAYAVRVKGTDRAGNYLVVSEYNGESLVESNKYTAKDEYFISNNKVLDKTSPVAELKFVDPGAGHTYGITSYYGTNTLSAKSNLADITFKDNQYMDGKSISYQISNKADVPVANESDKITAEFAEDKKLDEATNVESGKKAEINVPSNDGAYAVRIKGEDKAGNALIVTEFSGTDKVQDSVNTAKGYFVSYNKVIDRTAPQVSISYTEPGAKHYYGNYAYYNKSVGTALEADYAVTETNFDNSKIQIGYKLNGADVANYRAVSAKTDRLSVPIADNIDNDHYQFAVFGEDKAGNPLTVIENQTTEPDESITQEKHNEGNAFVSIYDKVIDTVAPVYTLNITSGGASNKDKNAQGNRYYFNSGFTAEVNVEETNMDSDRIYVYRADDEGSSAINSQTAVLGSGFKDRIESKSKTYTDTVSAGDGVYRYQIYGTDRAGNALVPKTDALNNVNLDGTWKVEPYDDESVSDLSVHVVLDTVKPEIDVSVKEDGGSEFYKAKLSSEEKYSQSQNLPYRSVTKANAVISGTDYSPISLKYIFESTSGSKNTNVNYPGSSYIWKDSQTASFDGEQTVRITRLTAEDLAGNTSTAALSYDGAVSTWMYLDVTPPDYDDLAPTVAMKTSGNTEGKAKGGVYGPDGNDLYTSDVTVNVTVTDPHKEIQASGLYEVYYKVEVNGEDWTNRNLVRIASSTDSGVSPTVMKDGVINYGTAGFGIEIDKNEKLTYADHLTFTFDASTFNYNDVKLTVWAVDNSGNEIASSNYASCGFGVDITSPTIRVTYDNNDALNEKYFKADRVATIVVTERNFDEDSTPIDTQAAASVGKWTHESGSAANGDEDTWTCEVTYSVDGDYTFDVDTTDLAGNSMSGSVDYGDSVAPQDFILDKTLPLITVTYDNNNASNGFYYNAPRVATLQVEEHNFNPVEVEVVMTASDNGAVIGTPSVVGWSDSGDMHTAHISFNYDGEFTFAVSYVDLAGNEAADYEEDHFIVDLTVPSIEIVDIVNMSANNGIVAPGVNISDTNYDADGVSVTFNGYNNGEVSFDSSRTIIANGQNISFADIPHIQDNDDLYTLTARAVDLAGNEYEDSVMFSVNRFGSVYILSDATQALVDGYYANEEIDLQVEEINVDTLEFKEITYSKDGDIITLEEGSDFTVEESGSEVTWKSYTYTIDRDNFAEEGVYTVTISSEDRATNKMNNKMTSKDIDFVIDKTAPSVVITGVEDKAQYNADSRTVTIDAQDNILLDKVYAYINGDASVKEFDREKLMDSDGLINIPIGSSNDWQTIRVVSVDAAGNRMETEEIRFLITTNIFYQWYRNTVVFYASIVGIIAAGAFFWFLIFAKRKKEEKEEA